MAKFKHKVVLSDPPHTEHLIKYRIAAELVDGTAWADSAVWLFEEMKGTVGSRTYPQWTEVNTEDGGAFIALDITGVRRLHMFLTQVLEREANKCTACAGSGCYAVAGSPKCGACKGTGRSND